MWGMGNRREPTGPDETSERSLFKVLEAKNANRSASAGSVAGRPWLLGAQGALALRGCRGNRGRVRGDPVRLQREPGYLRLRARRQRRPRRCDDAARRLGDDLQRERKSDGCRQCARNGLRHRRHRCDRYRLRRRRVEGRSRYQQVGLVDGRHPCQGRHRRAYAAVYGEKGRRSLLRARARRHASRRRQHGLLVHPGSDGWADRRRRIGPASTRTATFSFRAH